MRLALPRDRAEVPEVGLGAPGTWPLAIRLAAAAGFAVILFGVFYASIRNGTLGNDYLAYDAAVRRLLAGGPLYDQAANVAGVQGLYLYPPSFVLLALPLAVFPPQVSAVVFTALVAIAFVAAVAAIPVSPRVRWIVLLLGEVSWPLIYSFKLGQVGPILLLTFALGWRWIDRPARLGAVTAFGAAMKLQPAILFAWALVTGRGRAVAVGVAVLALLVGAATIVTGPQAWFDQASLLARVSQPITTPHNFTPGHIALAAGFSEQAAWAIQVANWVDVAIVVGYAIWRASPVASYIAVVIASQLVSPVLWDHYALVLLLPVAWLLVRNQWWAVLIPLATSVPLLGITPDVVYPVAFWVTLLAVVAAGTVDRARAMPPAPGSVAPVSIA